MRPQFSIATPTRNRLGHLKRCVGSVRGQTGVTREHLIQDARSTDGTCEWLRGQADVGLVSEADEGMYDAINRVWRRSHGEFLCWLNSDEQYLPGTLERVARAFAADPAADVIWGDVIVADAEGRPIALRREIPFRRIYVVNNFLYVLSCAAFFRRSLLDRGLLVFDARYRLGGDMDLMLRLSRGGAVFRHLPQYLSVFGNDGGNQSNDGVRVEAELEQVRRAHGALSSRRLRRLVLVGRRVERMLIGAYARRPISYRYAIDEQPNYVEVAATEVGGRFTVKDVSGRPATIRALTPR